MTPVELILDRLEGVRSCAGGSVAKCPAHDDRKPSLSVREGEDGRVLLHCHAGCSFDAVVAALGIRADELFPRSKSTATRSGPKALPMQEPLEADEAHLQRCQRALLGNKKAVARLGELRGWTRAAIERLGLGLEDRQVIFPVRDMASVLCGTLRYQPNPELRQENSSKLDAPAGTPRELFPPPETLPASEEWLLLVEGEPDAVAAFSAGLQAVAAPGANGWKREWAERFRGRRVAVVADCDGPGRKAATARAEELAGVAVEVRLVDLDRGRDDGYDLTDQLRQGGAPKVRAMIEASPTFMPRNGAVAVPASRVRRKQVRWLWPCRVPLGEVTLLVGQEGLGKSLLTCALAAGLSRGSLLEAPGAALFLTAEDALEFTIKPRLEAAGADLDLCHFVVMRRDGLDIGMALPDDLQELERLVVEIEAKLVVVDPLSAHLGGSVDSWKDQSVRTALAPLHKLAEKQGCAVVGVGHLNKANGSDALRRTSGSVALTAAARSVLLLGRDPEDPEGEAGSRRVLAHAKSNLSKKAPSVIYEIEEVVLRASGDEPEAATARILEVGESDLTARDLLAPFVEGEERSALDGAVAFLREILGDGRQIRAKEMIQTAEEAGIHKRTLERAKAVVGVRSERVGGLGEQGCFVWYIPNTANADTGTSDNTLGGDSKNGSIEPKQVEPPTNTASDPVNGDVGGHSRA